MKYYQYDRKNEDSSMYILFAATFIFLLIVWKLLMYFVVDKLHIYAILYNSSTAFVKWLLHYIFSTSSLVNYSKKLNLIKH